MKSKDLTKRERKIGLIGSERLEVSLGVKFDVFLIDSCNFYYILKYIGLDLIIVESLDKNFDSYFSFAEPKGLKFLSELSDYASKQSVPIIYWYTKSAIEVESYIDELSIFGGAFASSEVAVEKLRLLGLSKGYLAPAVEPNLYSRVSYSIKKTCSVIVDGGLPVKHEHLDALDYYSSYTNITCRVIDSTDLTIFNENKPVNKGKIGNGKGYISFSEMLELLRNVDILILPPISIARFQATSEWLLLEALAAGVVPLNSICDDQPSGCVFNNIDMPVSDWYPNISKVELEKISIDPVYLYRLKKMAQDSIGHDMTLEYRIESLLN